MIGGMLHGGNWFEPLHHRVLNTDWKVQKKLVKLVFIRRARYRLLDTTGMGMQFTALCSMSSTLKSGLHVSLDL
jgi:hypothetical protein